MCQTYVHLKNVQIVYKIWNAIKDCKDLSFFEA